MRAPDSRRRPSAIRGRPPDGRRTSDPGPRPASGTVALVLNGLLEIGLSFLTTVLLARSLGPADFGRLNWALSWAIVVAMIADGGFTFYVGKLVARRGGRWRSSYREAWTVKLFLACAGGAGALILFAALPTLRPHAGLLTALLAGEILRSFSVYACFAFRGLQRATLEPVVLGGERLILLLLIAGALRAGWG